MKLDSINRSEAFRYLGYGKSTPDEVICGIADEVEDKLLAAIDAKYVYKYFPIESTFEACVTLCGTSLELVGRSISEHLKGCFGVALFTATLSGKVDQVIRSYQVTGMSHAVIADAFSSAAIEQVCDMVEEEISKKFPGKYFTFRFSPGYGDLPLDIQPEFLMVCDAGKRIGVNITEGGLMTPVKSVSAIIGISDTPPKNTARGCTTCMMKNKCKYRIQGEHCGN